jgi:hypothetical protein
MRYRAAFHCFFNFTDIGPIIVPVGAIVARLANAIVKIGEVTVSVRLAVAL